MEAKDQNSYLHVSDRSAWRKWLEHNHLTAKGISLVIYNTKSSEKGIRYVEAVEEALCFGWIDGKTKKRDHDSTFQYFSKRNPRSYWSKSNRKRVESLIEKGLMTSSGQELINLAMKTGTWSALEEIENLIIPDDLQKLFNLNKIAYKNFESFSKSSKGIILGWIMSAKRPDTRQKRIELTVALAEKNIKAK